MAHRRTTPKLISTARELRQNQTAAEARLWRFLRAHQVDNVHFRRQHAIGNHIVDFVAPRQKLVIEVDGGGHLEQEDYDHRRTEFLQSKGYKVLRFWNSEVMKDIEGVMREILAALETRCDREPSPTDHP